MVTAGLAIAMLPVLRPVTPGNTGPVDLFLMLSLGAFAMWAAPRGVPLGVPYAAPVTLAVVAGGIAGLLADGSGFAAVVLPLVQDLWLLGVAAVLFNVGRTPAAVRRLGEIWCLSAIAWAAVLALGVATGQNRIAGVTERTGSRAALTLGDSNITANYFLVALALIVAFGYPAGRLRRWAACALLLICVLLTGSNGGIFSALAVVVGLTIFAAHRRLGAVSALACASLLVLGSVSQASACLDSSAPVVPKRLCLIDPNEVVAQAKASDVDLLADSVGRAGQSTSQRGELFTESASLYRRNSLLGIGPAQTKNELRLSLAPFVKEAHNDYAAALIERGWLGGAALVALLIAVGKRLTRVFHRRLDPSWRAVLPRPEALVAAAVVVAVAGWFYEVLHLRHVWALLALIAAIAHWGRAAAPVPVVAGPDSRDNDDGPSRHRRGHDHRKGGGTDDHR